MQRVEVAPLKPQRAAGTGTRPPVERPIAPAGRDTAPTVGEYDHLGPLVSEFAALGPHDPRRRALREELLRRFLPVAHHIAARYRDRGEPIADLQQAATIGLLLALDRFDPDHGSAFLSYAVPTITGEIRRHFRDRTWAMRVPRALKDLRGPVREAITTLSARLGRAPKPSEIAAHLDLAVEVVVEALQAAHAHTTHSLDTPTSSTEQPSVAYLGRVDTMLEVVENRPALQAAFAQLPERERHILSLRFFDDMTQTQIAAQLGISQMHVSRLLARALATLRGRIDS